MSLSIIKNIQNIFPHLSSQERKVAEYVLKNSELIPNISIVDLAHDTNTSTATISRLTKKAGCENFVEFKLAFLAEVEPISFGELDGTEIEKEIYSHYTKAIANTRKLNNEKDFERVSNAIKKARKIYVIGVGSSGFTAEEFSRRLMRMGIEAIAITDSNLMYIMSSLFTAGELVIAISMSGATREVKEVVNIANQAKLETICLTSFGNSDIARMCGIVLLSYNNVFLDSKTFINTQFSIGFLIDNISSILLRDDKYRKIMNKTIETIHQLNNRNNL